MVPGAVVLDLQLKNHSSTRQLICYLPPWALLETDFTGKRATENVSRQCVCVPETPSSCDFKSILFSLIQRVLHSQEDILLHLKTKQSKGLGRRVKPSTSQHSEMKKKMEIR